MKTTRIHSFTTWTCLFWLNFVPCNIFNVFPLFDNVLWNVSWYRFLSIVVSVWIELESMSVCRNKASNSLQTLGSSLKKNERKKERKTWNDQNRKKNELICVTHKGEKGFSLFWWRTVKVLYFLIRNCISNLRKWTTLLKLKNMFRQFLTKSATLWRIV